MSLKLMMLSKLFLVLLPLLNIQVIVSAEKPHDESENGPLSTMEIILKYDYPAENHTITTKDGYLLNVFRILPNSKKCAKNDTKKLPVLLQHGLEISSGPFVVAGPKRGLGFLLSDECYDVWLINYRGTKYSTKHVNLTVDDPEYWDFGFHELGMYDNLDTYNYILKLTGAPKLLCICHSQGCSSFFATSSLLPEYTKNRVAAMMCLSPSAYGGFTRGLARVLFTAIWFMSHTEVNTGLSAFPRMRNTIKTTLEVFCSDELFYSQQYVCKNIFFGTFGKDPGQLNATLLPVYFGHFLEGASSKQHFHISQSIVNKDFKQYNYGEAQNLVVYNSTTPPDYPLDKSTTPVAVWYGANDNPNPPGNIRWLEKRLANLIGTYMVPWKDWNHLDFVIAKDVKKLLYDHLFEVMAQFN